jgi:hypothetical protein
MRKHTGTWVLAASALAFLAPASAAVAEDTVPIMGNVTITPDLSITGIVSHLGSVTGAVNLRVPTSQNTFTDYFTLVAANGDTLLGVGMVTLFPAANPLVLNFIETITITGGTGRFVGASGSNIMGQGQVSLATGVAHESFNGTISLPDSLE